jgi:hypothetical protein
MIVPGRVTCANYGPRELWSRFALCVNRRGCLGLDLSIGLQPVVLGMRPFTGQSSRMSKAPYGFVLKAVLGT